MGRLIGMLSVALLTLCVGCQGSSAGQFACLGDQDCPPGCICEGGGVSSGVCNTTGPAADDCGGTCDRETDCPGEQTCQYDTTKDGVVLYACKGGEPLGGACTSNADCDPNASPLGVFCCLDSSDCGGDLNTCVEDCSQYSSGGVVRLGEGETCQDNSECGDGLFCCLVPDPSGNCDFGLDQSCTCRSDSGSTECEGELFVEMMTSGVPCVAPDVSACSGCDDYCIGNGFAFGSTDEACDGGFCQCACAYCVPN